MLRRLYHGSINIVKEPTFRLGNKNNDYGFGFYCATNKTLGKEWASKRNGFGYLNEYEIRDDNLNILDLTKPPFNNVLFWVALLMHNRDISDELKNNYPRELEYLETIYLINTDDYDIVIGYRADDSYFHFPEAFVRSEITLKSLNEIFLAGELGKQYVLISKKAFNKIKFVKYEEVLNKYQGDYYSRKEIANNKFKELLIKDRYSKDTRMRDLINE